MAQSKTRAKAAAEDETDMETVGYHITLKDGYVDTDLQGRITADHSSGRQYNCAPHDGWRITGISTRLDSRRLVSLEDAANGAVIGQGWVHDFDHGTHRRTPSSRRAVRVVNILKEVQ